MFSVDHLDLMLWATPLQKLWDRDCIYSFWPQSFAIVSSIVLNSRCWLVLTFEHNAHGKESVCIASCIARLPNCRERRRLESDRLPPARRVYTAVSCRLDARAEQLPLLRFQCARAPVGE